MIMLGHILKNHTIHVQLTSDLFGYAQALSIPILSLTGLVITVVYSRAQRKISRNNFELRLFEKEMEFFGMIVDYRRRYKELSQNPQRVYSQGEPDCSNLLDFTFMSSDEIKQMVTEVSQKQKSEITKDNFYYSWMLNKLIALSDMVHNHLQERYPWFRS